MGVIEKKHKNSLNLIKYNTKQFLCIVFTQFLWKYLTNYLTFCGNNVINFSRSFTFGQFIDVIVYTQIVI